MRGFLFEPPAAVAAAPKGQLDEAPNALHDEAPKGQQAAVAAAGPPDAQDCTSFVQNTQALQNAKGFDTPYGDSYPEGFVALEPWVPPPSEAPPSVAPPLASAPPLSDHNSWGWGDNSSWSGWRDNSSWQSGGPSCDYWWDKWHTGQQQRAVAPKATKGQQPALAAAATVTQGATGHVLAATAAKTPPQPTFINKLVAPRGPPPQRPPPPLPNGPPPQRLQPGSPPPPPPPPPAPKGATQPAVAAAAKAPPTTIDGHVILEVTLEALLAVRIVPNHYSDHNAVLKFERNRGECEGDGTRGLPAVAAAALYPCVIHDAVGPNVEGFSNTDFFQWSPASFLSNLQDEDIQTAVQGPTGRGRGIVMATLSRLDNAPAAGSHYDHKRPNHEVWDFCFTRDDGTCF